MPRTPTQDPEILAQDMQRLLRIVRRAQENTTRPRKDNEELIRHLNRCIEILASRPEACGSRQSVTTAAATKRVAG